jgi:hypothetical protein
MTKTKQAEHTPEPWEARGYEIYLKGAGFLVPKSVENARIQAAAQDLLAAAEEALSNLEPELPQRDRPTREEVAGHLRAAIDKAKGGA